MKYIIIFLLGFYIHIFTVEFIDFYKTERFLNCKENVKTITNYEKCEELYNLNKLEIFIYQGPRLYKNFYFKLSYTTYIKLYIKHVLNILKE